MNINNIKYHTLNIISVTLFSLVSALTINQIFKSLLTSYPSESRKGRLTARSDDRVSDININKILESGFFRISSGTDDLSTGSAESASQLTELKLLGTVTGPPDIARAMIMKKGEKQAEIFKLWKDVYGYTLSGIDSSKVYLKRDKLSYTLDMYEKKDISTKNVSTPVSFSQSGDTKKTISRAEFQQKMLNNIDNAMQGVNVGPYRVNGEIEGFHLIRIRPYNILYDYGLRSGDIIKRINGKKIDSTEKLYNMWQGFKNESKLTFDIERNGKIVTLDVTITD